MCTKKLWEKAQRANDPVCPSDVRSNGSCFLPDQRWTNDHLRKPETGYTIELLEMPTMVVGKRYMENVGLRNAYEQEIYW